MKFKKSEVPGAERKLNEPPLRLGYCKACRTWDVLWPEEDFCFTCKPIKRSSKKWVRGDGYALDYNKMFDEVYR